MCWAALAVMGDGRYGRIISMASTVGIRGLTDGAMKGGAVSLAKALEVELASRGITVNAVTSDPVETRLVARHPAEVRQSWLDLDGHQVLRGARRGRGRRHLPGLERRRIRDPATCSPWTAASRRAQPLRRSRLDSARGSHMDGEAGPWRCPDPSIRVMADSPVPFQAEVQRSGFA